MKSDLIFENGNIKFKEKTYVENEYNDLIKVIGSKIRIIILGENILVKYYKTTNRNINFCINEIYEKEAIFSGDFLMDYKYIRRKNEVYTYKLKKMPYINKIVENARTLQVMPIQYLIHKFVKKNVKAYISYIIVSRINNDVYIVDIDNNVITNSFIFDYSTFTVEKLCEINLSNKPLIMDNNISININKHINKNVICLQIGEQVYEKIHRL